MNLNGEQVSSFSVGNINKRKNCILYVMYFLDIFLNLVRHVHLILYYFCSYQYIKGFMFWSVYKCLIIVESAGLLRCALMWLCWLASSGVLFLSALWWDVLCLCIACIPIHFGEGLHGCLWIVTVWCFQSGEMNEIEWMDLIGWNLCYVFNFDVNCFGGCAVFSSRMPRFPNTPKPLLVLN